MSVTTTWGDASSMSSRSCGQVGRPAHEVEVGLAVDDARDALPEERIVLRQYHPDARHAKRTVARTSEVPQVGGYRSRGAGTPRRGRGWHPW